MERKGFLKLLETGKELKKSEDYYELGLGI